MASNNETVAEISKEQHEYAVQVYGVITAPSTKVWKLADRIAAAHKREVAAKDDERLTIVANYENVIAAKDREIAELRKCLKVAEDALTELQTRLVSSVYDGTMNPYEALEITERAIAAISEKGGAK